MTGTNEDNKNYLLMIIVSFIVTACRSVFVCLSIRRRRRRRRRRKKEKEEEEEEGKKKKKKK
jgi:membrane protein implicated in regulation of membrane protease activity